MSLSPLASGLLSSLGGLVGSSSVTIIVSEAIEVMISPIVTIYRYLPSSSEFSNVVRLVNTGQVAATNRVGYNASSYIIGYLLEWRNYSIWISD